MTRKKNKFFTFCFSLIPGAGEMYMGFMKMGLSLMGAFILICAVATIFEMGPIMFLAIIAWFYSFFHVHNLAGMPDEEFYALEDDYLFHLCEDKTVAQTLTQKYRKLLAVVLIILGVVLLWNSMIGLMWSILPDSIMWIVHDIGYRLPKIILGVATIVAGIYLISGKKKELDMQDEKSE